MHEERVRDPEGEGERLNIMIGLSLNARKLCIIRLVKDRIYVLSSILYSYD